MQTCYANLIIFKNTKDNQVMKQFLFLFLCISATYTYSQKTITKRGYNGRPYLTYQINAKGDYHGLYTKYFDNGTIELQETYVIGKMRAKKLYEYSGSLRYLVLNATYDAKGKVLTKYIQANDQSSTLKQVAGLLKNGRWYDVSGIGIGDYIEKYNGSDIEYAWTDRTKKKFIGKFLNDQRIYSENEIKIFRQIAKRDSIKQDLCSNSDNRNKPSAIYNLANQYHIKLDSVYAGDEAKFYNDLVKALQTTKDTTLKSMITDALYLNNIDHPEKLEYNVLQDYYCELQVYAHVTYVILYPCKDRYKDRNRSGYNIELPETEIKLAAIIDYISKTGKPSW